MVRYNQRLRFQNLFKERNRIALSLLVSMAQLVAPETLWSIASKLRPDSSVSVQQTLLAIYRLNPQAFENQNIHSLLPASNLRVPSLEQTRASSTQQAINIMNSHLAKLDKPTTKRLPPNQKHSSTKSN